MSIAGLDSNTSVSAGKVDLEATIYKTAKISSIKKQLIDVIGWLQGQKRVKQASNNLSSGEVNYTHATDQDYMAESLLDYTQVQQ